jgi:transposase-like protein
MLRKFRSRPLDAGPYTFVACDALTMKVREGGRVFNVAVLVATGVNGDGHREILGLQVATTEDGAGWLTFFSRPHRQRTDRGETRHLETLTPALSQRPPRHCPGRLGNAAAPTTPQT